MENRLKAVLLGNEKKDFDALIERLRSTGRQYFLRNEILQVFSELCNDLKKPQYFFHTSPLGELIQFTHEILIDHQSYWLVLRPSVAQQLVFRVDIDSKHYTQVPPAALLACRDKLVNCEDCHPFEINLEPFFAPEFTIQDPRNIGEDFNFFHQYLVNKHAQDWEDTLFQIIHQCRYQRHSFLIGPDICNAAQLKAAIEPAYRCLERYSEDDDANLIVPEFKSLGLEPGWGNTVGRCRATLKLLERVIQCPDACSLEAFLSKIPNLFSMVSISVHGWVGQDNVLGKAETAGQVAYVLDQARNLEKKLIETLELAGLGDLGIEPQVILLTRLIPNCEGTQCATQLEKIHGTRFAKILRIPFRDESHEMVPSWLSRYNGWPYLEEFASEACTEMMKLFWGRKPDLVLGHYSDGNLVAYRIAKQLQTLHCSIAHSLEKTRHLFSDLYWQELEGRYHFSKQFAADLISMNASNFIVTSSQHEIFGTHDTIGQYESYKCFTLPNLVHVTNGVNLKSARFSIVPPGVDEAIFFPHTQDSHRSPEHTARLSEELFSETAHGALGELMNPQRRPIFVFSPVLPGKNLPELIRAFGAHEALQDQCNLILLTGQNRSDQAENPEQELILSQMHRLIRDYRLESHMRWIGQRFSSEDLGEIYRIIADHNGILLHGPSFEAFGLTLLEAMVSGLPVFATKFGGAVEIVAPGKHGFLINPTEMPQVMDQILSFVDSCNVNPGRWKSFSEAGIHRVQRHYTWSNHVNRIVSLAKIHKHVSRDHQSQQAGLHQYLEALYQLIYKQQSLRFRAFESGPSSPSSLGNHAGKISSSSPSV